MLDYAAKSKKIKNVWIFSNGTMIPSDELIEVMKRYKKKFFFVISNYSSNIELKNILKHDAIIKKLKENNVNFYLDDDFKWGYTSEEIHDSNRSKEKNVQYFLKCQSTCSAIFDGNIFVCPRAGVFYLKNLYEFDKNEQVSIKHPDRNLKDKLIEFYSRDYFGACNYCTIIEDRLKDDIVPALQMK